MKKWIEAILLAAVLAGAGACTKAEDESAQPATTEEGAADGDQAPLADEELPVQTDFEEEAAAQITTDNYQAELEALEKEIATQE